MENLKKGDLIEIKNSDYMLRVPKGSRLFVKNQLNQSIVQIECILHVEIKDIKKIGESQMQYEESNRYKLAQAIKKTGLKVSMLSAAASNNTNSSYFTNYQAKSRFNERGDISEARLNELLTDLAFAEREVLGIGAKTMDEAPIFTINGNPIEATKTGKGSYSIDIGKDFLGEVVEYTGTPYDEGKPKSNKPLFIGAVLVISIVLILLILNNYFQVV